MERVSQKTYKIVIERCGGRCQHPDCGVMGVQEYYNGKVYWIGVEYHHVIFRSITKLIIDDPKDGTIICPPHHRTGEQAAHISRYWRYYYYQFLPKEFLEKYAGMSQKYLKMLLKSYQQFTHF